jgi:hypothetical protein
MSRAIFLLLLLASFSSWGWEIQFNPRYEMVGSDGGSVDQPLLNRLVYKGSLSEELGRHFKFYFEGFGDLDSSSPDQREWSREGQQFFVQEASLEFKKSWLFVKVGRQAARWSDSWALPSLDVWTARRLNRMYVDPLPEQLIHSDGAVVSIVRQNWSVDVAGMWRVAENVYPEPYPKTLPVDTDGQNFGARLKGQWDGLQVGAIGARADKKSTLGVFGNYAFDSFVPKFEIGEQRNDQNEDVIVTRNLQFGSAGIDFFWGDWVVTPQITAYKGLDPSVPDPYAESLLYLNISWTHKNHELQSQNYWYTSHRESFASLIYTYYFRQKMGLSGFIQNYDGEPWTITGDFASQTGGFLGGVRLSYNGDFIF